MKFKGRIIRNEFIPEYRDKYEDWRSKHDGEAVEIEIKSLNNQRTLSQNNALHLWCDQVAEALNDAGMDIKKFYEGGMDVPWRMESVKEYIWKVGMEYHNLPSTSTAKLTKEQINEVWEICNRALGARGVHVDFPSWERQELIEE